MTAARDLGTVLQTLRAHRARLEEMGVVHAAIFGSLARGEATSSSDIDVLVELDPERPIGVWGFVGVLHYLQELFGPAVDLADQDGLRPRMRDRILRERVHAF